jgi:hypothetical protein
MWLVYVLAALVLFALVLSTFSRPPRCADKDKRKDRPDNGSHPFKAKRSRI